MWLRLALLALFAAYVGHRLDLAWQLRRARRTGDTTRVEALRRRERYAFWGAIGVLVVGGLLLAGLVWLNSH
jgi:hypothetical protein